MSNPFFPLRLSKKKRRAELREQLRSGYEQTKINPQPNQKSA